MALQQLKKSSLSQLWHLHDWNASCESVVWSYMCQGPSVHGFGEYVSGGV